MSFFVLLLLAQPGPADLGRQYLTAIARADSLYRASRYEQALSEYRRAHRLIETEPGPLVGMGWTELRLGDFASAETAFRRVLAVQPNNARAREGRAQLPVSYRFKLTGTLTSGRSSTRSFGGFLEYNHHFRTTVTFGFQSVAQESGWCGYNSVLVIYRRLRYPWSVRLDLFTLAATTDPRYWRMVYAPSLLRLFDGTPVRLTFIGWDRLNTVAVEAGTECRIAGRFTTAATPALNLSPGKPGWFLPLSLRFDILPWLGAKTLAGLGTIADYVDLEVPTLYNQSERLVATMRAGVDATVRRRFRAALFAAWERYDDRSNRFFVSLTLSAIL